MTNLLDEQIPIDRAIANALVMATPDTWGAIKMTVSREVDERFDRTTVTISSPEGHSEPIRPTDEILEFLSDLFNLFNAHEIHCRGMVYYLSQDPAGGWDYHVNFDY